MFFRFPLVLTLCAATGVAAQDGAPLSAIDWLSRSVEPAPGEISPQDEAPVANEVATPEVRVTPLDSPSPDPVGILGSATTGLPATLWSASDVDTLATLIRAEGMPSLPALQDFLVVLLLAEADPPLGAGPDGAFFLARVDKLLDMGRLDQAMALLDAADPDSGPLFRRWFDAALLTGSEDAACAKMAARPGIAPTEPARIFCLARAGDWPAAALSLNTHRALGDVTAEEDALLSRFLDPDLFEGDPPLPRPARISPLNFRMMEAIGEGLPTSDLPLAFAHADLRDTAGWKARLEAAERLSRAGALPPPVLQSLYTARRPSASGGVWDRVDAFQDFDTALTAGDPDVIADTLLPAWEAMRQIRAERAFAELYARPLAEAGLDGAAGDLAFRIALLSSDYEEFALAGSDSDPFLAALARGVPQEVPATGQMALAVQDAFNGAAPPDTLRSFAESGRLGEALLRAVASLQAGVEGDPVTMRDGLAFLRSLGLEDLARRTALQLMILDRSA